MLELILFVYMFACNQGQMTFYYQLMQNTRPFQMVNIVWKVRKYFIGSESNDDKRAFLMGRHTDTLGCKYFDRQDLTFSRQLQISVVLQGN